MGERLKGLRERTEKYFTSTISLVERGRERIVALHWKNALIGTALGYIWGVAAPEALVPLQYYGFLDQGLPKLLFHIEMSPSEVHNLADNIAKYTGVIGGILGFSKHNALVPFMGEGLRSWVRR